MEIYITIILSCIHLSFCADVKTFIFKNKERIDESAASILDTYLHESGQTTVIQCGRRCKENPSCLEFSYDVDLQNCELYNDTTDLSIFDGRTVHQYTFEEGSCGNGYTILKKANICVKYHDSNDFDYVHMQEVCTYEGGQLLRITDEVAQHEVAEYLGNYNLIPGLRVMVQGRANTTINETWVFDDDTPLLFTSWIFGQPNTDNHKCVSLHEPSFDWNNVHCGSKRPFICETEI